MRLSKNLASLNVYRNYKDKLRGYSSSMDKISSGFKINKSKDNPNKMAESEKQRLMIRSLNMAARNSQDAMSMIQAADGTLTSIAESLNRARELVIQSGGATNAEDKKVIEQEINEIVASVQSMAEKGDFNGVNILNDTTITDNDNPNEIKVMIGSNVGELMKIDVYDVSSKGLNIADADGNSLIDLSDPDASLSLIDDALNTVIKIRSKNGAMQNKFESVHENILELRDRNVTSESKIRDVDIAEETINLTKNQLLIDAGQAIMSQTNSFPKDILRVLESVRGR